MLTYTWFWYFSMFKYRISFSCSLNVFQLTIKQYNNILDQWFSTCVSLSRDTIVLREFARLAARLSDIAGKNNFTQYWFSKRNKTQIFKILAMYFTEEWLVYIKRFVLLMGKRESLLFLTLSLLWTERKENNWFQ